MGMSLKQIRYLYAIGVFKRNPDSKGLGKTQSLSENKLKTMRAIGKVGASLKVGEVSSTHRVKIGSETYPIQKHKNQSTYPVVNGKMLGSKDLPDKPMSLVRTDIKAKKAEKTVAKVDTPTEKKLEVKDLKTREDVDNFVGQIRQQIFGFRIRGESREIKFDEKPPENDVDYAVEKLWQSKLSKEDSQYAEDQLSQALIDYGSMKADSIIREIQSRGLSSNRQVLDFLHQNSHAEIDPDIVGPFDVSQNRQISEGIKAFREIIPSSTLQYATVTIDYTKQRSNYSQTDGVVYLDWQGTSHEVVAHELTHMFESNSRTWPKIAQNFVDTVADKSRGLAKISDLTGNPTYAPNEVAYRPRSGIKLRDPYVLKQYKPPHSEVLSMAMDQMSWKPYEFMQSSPYHFQVGLAALHTPLLQKDLY